MSDYSLFYTLHPISRSLLGLALLSLATATSSLMYGFMLILIAALFVRVIENSWNRVGRSVGLLRWFIIPILALHLLFSPGQLILPGWPLPFTWEGLQLGLHLSVHLAVIFFAAITLFLCLTRNEWIQALLLMPFSSRAVATYVILIAPLRRSEGDLLHALRLQWKLRSSWPQSPQMLVSAFSAALAVAEVQSQQLWLRWPATAVTGLDSPTQAASLWQIASWLSAMIGLLGLGVAWQM
ncbi:hypothetical protein [Mariprofundus sp. KV]|uniref:hypothetical protein n=1 Tax=Mariprofundus sp. KV TaxID=2608715 RepID=UPI0015A04127|nr:hypothetical protein [Mariprofundus sp. KV]NWF37046.1 hypothetical protein [Mariprofundus sp. KV]